MLSVGLEVAAIGRVLAQNDHSLVREWADITLPAKERFGDQFFQRSPQAYFLDNLKHARLGQRQPPDWWRELNKAEQRQQDQAVWQTISDLFPASTPTAPTKDKPRPSGPESVGHILGITKRAT